MDQIKHLSNSLSNGTTLISYYVPAGKDSTAVSAHINRELSECLNIKSAQTRKNVQSALRLMQHHLKGSTKMPMNGLAIFASAQSYV